MHWCTQKLEKEKKTQFVLGSVEDIQGLNQESIQEGMFFFFYSLFFGFLIVAVLFVFFELESEKHRLTEREYSNFTLINCFVLFIATGSAKITSSKTECVFLGA